MYCVHNIAIKNDVENEFFADFNDVLVDNVADNNDEINDLHVRNRNRNEIIDRRMQMFRELFPE